MIKSFGCKATEAIYHRDFSRKFPHNIQRSAIRKLWMLDAVTNLKDLRIPISNHLEALKGKRKGQHSIRINKQWRICFKWHDGNAHSVEIVDYH